MKCISFEIYVSNLFNICWFTNCIVDNFTFHVRWSQVVLCVMNDFNQTWSLICLIKKAKMRLQELSPLETISF